MGGTYCAADWWPDWAKPEDMLAHARKALARAEKCNKVRLGRVRTRVLTPDDAECPEIPAHVRSWQAPILFVAEADVVYTLE